MLVLVPGLRLNNALTYVEGLCGSLNLHRSRLALILSLGLRVRPMKTLKENGNCHWAARSLSGLDVISVTKLLPL